MKPTKMMAALAIAGSLAAGTVALGTGVASADPGIGNAQIPADWGPPPPGPGWGPHRDHDRGPGGRNWGGNPPGTWNGGWEPDGGVCLFGACI